MSTSKINQAEWDALFDRLIAATDEVIAQQTSSCGQGQVLYADAPLEPAQSGRATAGNLPDGFSADDGGDCGPYEGEYHDTTEYEAAIRMSPQLCALCKKEIQRGFARYWRDKLLHQECLIPFISAQRMNPEHRYEEEA